MTKQERASWAHMAAQLNTSAGFDPSNTKPCKRGKHSCAFMQAALASKNGSLDRAVSFTTGESGGIAFVRVPRKLPFLVLSYCPWCGEEI